MAENFCPSNSPSVSHLFLPEYHSTTVKQYQSNGSSVHRSPQVGETVDLQVTPGCVLRPNQHSIFTFTVEESLELEL